MPTVRGDILGHQAKGSQSWGAKTVDGGKGDSIRRQPCRSAIHATSSHARPWTRSGSDRPRGHHSVARAETNRLILDFWDTSATPPHSRRARHRGGAGTHQAGSTLCSMRECDEQSRRVSTPSNMARGAAGREQAESTHQGATSVDSKDDPFSPITNIKRRSWLVEVTVAGDQQACEEGVERMTTELREAYVLLESRSSRVIQAGGDEGHHSDMVGYYHTDESDKRRAYLGETTCLLTFSKDCQLHEPFRR